MGRGCGPKPERALCVTRCTDVDAQGARSLRRPAAGSCHLTAHPDGRVGGLDGYIRRAQRLDLRNIAVEFYAICEGEGEVALCQGEGSRRPACPRPESRLRRGGSGPS